MVNEILFPKEENQVIKEGRRPTFQNKKRRAQPQQSVQIQQFTAYKQNSVVKLS